MPRFLFVSAFVNDDEVSFQGAPEEFQLTKGAIVNPGDMGPRNLFRESQVGEIVEKTDSGDLLCMLIFADHENVELMSGKLPEVTLGKISGAGSLSVLLAPGGYVWLRYVESGWVIRWSGKDRPTVERASQPPRHCG